MFLLLFFSYLCAINETPTEMAPLITLDLSQLKHQGAEHRDDQINYVCHSSVQGKPINHIQTSYNNSHHEKSFFKFSIFLTEWHRCQTREWRKNIID
jgi:hypothetical protein